VDSGSTSATVFNALGERVEKSTGTLYWYGASGQVLSESDLSGNITDEYIFFDGRRIARVDSQGNADYYLGDSLGSARVVTDSNGTLLDDCDFLPFGDEECVTSGSGNNYKFDGMERDAESGLDHTLNRQYSSSYGRWVSPDPGGVKVVNLEDPQTWNLYAFVTDNPTTLTDPTGLHGTCSAEVANSHGGCQPAPTPECGGGEDGPGPCSQNSALKSRVNGKKDSAPGQNQAGEKPSSWAPDKPLPKDPTGLGPDWKKNPDYKNPHGEEYVNDKTGEKIEWNKGRPGPWGPNADRGKDGWHYTPPGGVRGRQFDPGQTIKRVTIGTAAAAGAAALLKAIIDTAPEWIPLLGAP
jgi:RHS repeat-associated protein